MSATITAAPATSAASGALERVIGASDVPDGPALGGTEVEYTVGFTSSDLWGDECEPGFSLFIDLYEHYLEAA